MTSAFGLLSVVTEEIQSAADLKRSQRRWLTVQLIRLVYLRFTCSP